MLPALFTDPDPLLPPYRSSQGGGQAFTVGTEVEGIFQLDFADITAHYLGYSLLIPRRDSLPAIHPVAVKLDPETRARMQNLAKTQHRSTHYLMREAIAQYVEREERREGVRQDALKAWAIYRATDQHVTHAEADDWLSQLESGQDVEPPECHN